MNEIIRKKAEEKYPVLEGFFQNGQSHDLIHKGNREAYTCGGEDAIGFMMKFVEWTKENYSVDSMIRWFTYKDPDDHPTTEQLLLKFLENEKP